MGACRTGTHVGGSLKPVGLQEPRWTPYLSRPRGIESNIPWGFILELNPVKHLLSVGFLEEQAARFSMSFASFPRDCCGVLWQRQQGSDSVSGPRVIQKPAKVERENGRRQLNVARPALLPYMEGGRRDRRHHGGHEAQLNESTALKDLAKNIWTSAQTSSTIMYERFM